MLATLLAKEGVAEGSYGGDPSRGKPLTRVNNAQTTFSRSAVDQVSGYR